jgi:hypothetical protein
MYYTVCRWLRQPPPNPILPLFAHLAQDAGADTRSSEFKEVDSVGPYRLIPELGHRGIGKVLLAECADGVLKRNVALKLRVPSLHRGVLVQRFERGKRC